MRPGLKRELSVLCGLGAAAGFARRSPLQGALLTLASGSLFLSSLQPAPYSYLGKSVLITGGSGGLGLALARQLVIEGAWVTLIARRAEELHDAKLKLLEIDPRAQVQTMVCDVTDPRQLMTAISETLTRFGRLDVLINNADSIELHLFAVIEAVKIARPLFRDQRGGKIINICSPGGRLGIPHMIPYGVSKFALAEFSQGITAELAREKIQVTTVYPSLMRTGSPVRNFPLLSMPAAKAAKKILEAARNGETELTLSVIGKARRLTAVFFPELTAAFTSLLARARPRGTSKAYKTGSQSRASFDQSRVPSHEAEFNLGLH